MRNIVIRSRVGKDGALRLEVPSELSGTDVEVTITPKPAASSTARGMGDGGWPPGFFEEVVGGWKGEPLTREPEGEYETRRIS